MGLVFFLSFFIIIAILLLFLKLCLTIDIIVEQNNTIKVDLTLIKILKHTFNIKIHTDLSKFKIEYIKNTKIKTIFELKKATIKREEKKAKHYLPLLNHLEINHFDLELTLGFKDAYKTSMICGFVNIFIYSAISVIKEKNNKVDCEYNLSPVFEYPIFNISLNCIICFRLANIIYEFIKIRRR